jgi:hypothetical protein
MKDKRSTSLIIAGSVFSISTTLAQIADIESQQVQILFAVPNVVVWLYVLYCYATFKRLKPARKHIKDLELRLSKNTELTYRIIPDKETLERVWELDQEAYGDYNIGFATLIDWWEQYPPGILTAIRGTKIIASMGIWPLTEDCFEELKEQRRKECDISKSHILSTDKSFECKTWYFSGIITNTPEQIFNLLIAEALMRWADSVSDKGSFRLLALAYTREDKDLLSLMNFQQHRPNQPKKFLPVYYQNIQSKADIIQLSTTLKG